MLTVFVALNGLTVLIFAVIFFELNYVYTGCLKYSV